MQHVYFISHASTGRIKIGFTRNLNTRLVGIASNFADPLSLLGNIEGGRPLEKALHEKLRKFRLKGEWFRDCAELRAVIDAVLAAGPSAIGFVNPPDKSSPADKSKKFGAVARALWPRKTAAHLAQRIGCSERAAQFYIDGERKISARCVQAIVNEILS